MEVTWLSGAHNDAALFGSIFPRYTKSFSVKYPNEAKLNRKYRNNCIFCHIQKIMFIKYPNKTSLLVVGVDY